MHHPLNPLLDYVFRYSQIAGDNEPEITLKLVNVLQLHALEIEHQIGIVGNLVPDIRKQSSQLIEDLHKPFMERLPFRGGRSNVEYTGSG